MILFKYTLKSNTGVPSTRSHADNLTDLVFLLTLYLFNKEYIIINIFK